MSTSTSATPLSAFEIARRKATIPAAGSTTTDTSTAPSSLLPTLPGTASTTTTGATQQTATGAAATTTPAATSTTQATAAAGQAAQPQAEAFNAPMLDLPESPSTTDVLNGLTRAMADDSVNETTAQRLFQFHEQLFAMEKAMTQSIIDGIVS